MEFCGVTKHKLNITERMVRISIVSMFFMSMEWDFVCELRPPAGLLFIPQMILDHGELRWNDIDRERPKYSEKSRPRATLSITKFTWTEPGANPGLRCDMPANNCLSHGTYNLNFTLSLPKNSVIRKRESIWINVHRICLFSSCKLAVGRYPLFSLRVTETDRIVKLGY
jgi:hypothetical protein